jgi:hypothetical protein
MGHRVFAVLLVVAIALFIWAALVFAEYVTFGTAGVLFTAGLAALAASQFHLCGHRYTQL